MPCPLMSSTYSPIFNRRRKIGVKIGTWGLIKKSNRVHWNSLIKILMFTPIFSQTCIPTKNWAMWAGHITLGIKKSLVQEPGISKISIRTSKYFYPISDGQVKNTVQGYIFLNAQHYLDKTSKNLGVLVRRTSKHFQIFLPLYSENAAGCMGPRPQQPKHHLAPVCILANFSKFPIAVWFGLV